VSERQNVHATGLVLGSTGVMLRGPSGSGKSLLTLSLIEAWETRGLRARLVADDRLDLVAERGMLAMHAPPTIAGLIELRGRGIVRRPHVDKARVHLVVDLVPKLERMVEEEDLSTEVFGVPLPRCPVPKVGVAELGHQQLLVIEALRGISTSRKREKTT
jgi:serine kinase of HPr protein (carbohydrate metabolism regulator)